MGSENALRIAKKILTEDGTSVGYMAVTSEKIFIFFFFQPITRRQILDSSKLKEFADDNFKFDENGRKLSKRVENTVGKGEIAR